MFVFTYFNREISEMSQPIGAKFCMVISTRPNFIMPVQNFGLPQKILEAKNMPPYIFFRGGKIGLKFSV